MGKVVIADEVFSVRESLALVLRGEHEVDTAASLQEAVQAAADADVLVAGFSPSSLDRTEMAALDRLPPRCRLLLLGEPGAFNLGRFTSRPKIVAFLSKPFDVTVLREKIRSLIHLHRCEVSPPERIAATDAAWRRFLEPPFIPAREASLLHRALTCHIPILLTGERGTGKRRIAHALHRLKGAEHLCHMTPEDCRQSLLAALAARTAAAPPGGTVTLYLEEIEQMGPGAQRDLLALLDAGAVPGLEPETQLWIVASATRSLDSLAASGLLCQELAYRIGALYIDLPPLRERGADLAAIIDLVSGDLTQRLKLERPIRFSPAALEQLKQYLWLGNLPELEAVIARTAALTQASEIGAADLVFTLGAGPTGGGAETAGPFRSPLLSPPASAGPPRAVLEALLGELAHELKNPMVTIKTFAQHLDSMLEDRASVADFQRLVDEAVERMDDLLERLLEFSRYRRPLLAEVDLSALLQSPLRRFREAAGSRRVCLAEHIATKAPVLADERQLSFALALLFEALASEVQAGAKVDVVLDSDGTLTISVSSDYAPIRNVSETAGLRDGEEALALAPLRAALAAMIIERNGGSLASAGSEDGKTVISVRLRPDERAAAPGGGGGDGKA